MPILAFMLLYVWLLLRRFFHWNFVIAIPVLALYAAAVYWLETRAPGPAPFGRAMNLPTLVLFLLAAIGFLLRLREAFARWSGPAPCPPRSAPPPPWPPPGCPRCSAAAAG